MGFNADEVVAPLDFDFTKFGGPKGTIREPSAKQLKELFKGVRTIIMPKLVPGFGEESGGDKAIDMRDVVSVLRNASEDLIESIQDETTVLVAAACSDFPSAEDLETLPYRVRSAFFGWFVGQLLSPELVAGGSSTSRSLRSVG